MKFYYYTGHEFLRENLRKKRVKVSIFDKLNDPFELTPYDVSNAELRKVHKDQFGFITQNMGLICLSKTRYSPAMWAHYAKNHMGACLEFEVTYDSVFEVDYVTEKLFPDLSLATFSKHVYLENLRKIWGTKSNEWTYEKEHRLLIPLSNKVIVKEGELYFMPFQEITDNTFMLKRVFVGYKCGLGISNLENDVKDYRHKVEVIQTTPAYDRFRVVEQKDKESWNMDEGEKKEGVEGWKEESLPAVQALFGR